MQTWRRIGVAVGLGALIGTGAWAVAQEAGPTLPPEYGAPPVVAATPDPATPPRGPAPKPGWAHFRWPWQKAPAGDDTQPPSEPREFSREHVVATPDGQHTQTWQGTSGPQGYEFQRSHVWTTPEGETIRSHEMGVTGTDPYNYQVQKEHVFRDGRTMEHTYTQTRDGTTIERERTFSGPNGQQRTQEQSRAWDGQSPFPEGQTPPPPSLDPPPAPPSSVAVSPPTAPPAEPDKPKRGWLGHLNPASKRSTPGLATAPATGRPSGFSLGSSTRSGWGAARSDLARRTAPAQSNAQRQWRQERVRTAERPTPPTPPRPHEPRRR